MEGDEEKGERWKQICLKERSRQRYGKKECEMEKTEWKIGKRREGKECEMEVDKFGEAGKIKAKKTMKTRKSGKSARWMS